MSETRKDAALDWADKAFEEADSVMYDDGLYVAHDENPMEALQRICKFLVVTLDMVREHQQPPRGIALSVVGIESVFRQLASATSRVSSYEFVSRVPIGEGTTLGWGLISRWEPSPPRSRKESKREK